MSNKNNASSGGLGLASVLTIIFVVLKLVGVIDWKWIWVLAPLWIDIILTVLIIVGFAICMVYEDKKWDRDHGVSSRNKRGKKDKWKF